MNFCKPDSGLVALAGFPLGSTVVEESLFLVVVVSELFVVVESDLFVVVEVGSVVVVEPDLVVLAVVELELVPTLGVVLTLLVVEVELLGLRVVCFGGFFVELVGLLVEDAPGFIVELVELVGALVVVLVVLCLTPALEPSSAWSTGSTSLATSPTSASSSGEALLRRSEDLADLDVSFSSDDSED